MEDALPLGARAWTRTTSLVFAALIALMLASLAWSVHPWFEAGDKTHDAAIYIACARSLLAGEGYSYLGMPFTVRPPGMSALIAAVWSMFGPSFYALNLSVSLFGIAAVAALFALTRPRLGTLPAAAVALLVWFNAEYQRLCNQPMSDVPGLALVLVGLLVLRWAEQRPSLARELVLGACIGLFAYLRTAVVLLVPAILAERFFVQWRAGSERAPWIGWTAQRVLPLALVVFAFGLPWSLRNAANHPEPPVDQNFLYSYSTGMWHADGGDPSSPPKPLAALWERIPGRSEKVLALVGSHLRASAGALPVALGALTFALLLVTTWKRRASAEWFVLGSSAILLVYFGYADRLVLPIYVLALPAAAEALAHFARRFLPARARVASGALLVAAVAAFTVRPRAGWTELERQHALYSELARTVDASVAPGARIASGIGWHYAVFLDRPVYSLFFAIRRANALAAAEQVIDKYAIDTVMLLPRVPADQALIPYFQARHGPARQVGDALLFQVRP